MLYSSVRILNSNFVANGTLMNKALPLTTAHYHQCKVYQPSSFNRRFGNARHFSSETEKNLTRLKLLSIVKEIEKNENYLNDEKTVSSIISVFESESQIRWSNQESQEIFTSKGFIQFLKFVQNHLTELNSNDSLKLFIALRFSELMLKIMMFEQSFNTLLQKFSHKEIISAYYKFNFWLIGIPHYSLKKLVEENFTKNAQPNAKFAIITYYLNFIQFFLRLKIIKINLYINVINVFREKQNSIAAAITKKKREE